jgi:hypothetical protein
MKFSIFFKDFLKLFFFIRDFIVHERNLFYAPNGQRSLRENNGLLRLFDRRSSRENASKNKF